MVNQAAVRHGVNSKEFNATLSMTNYHIATDKVKKCAKCGKRPYITNSDGTQKIKLAVDAMRSGTVRRNAIQAIGKSVTKIAV